jgi:hypothetical protein
MRKAISQIWSTLSPLQKRLVVLCPIVLAFFLTGPVWQSVESNRRSAIQRLFLKAGQGDEASLKKLISYRSPYANQMLRRLFFNEPASRANQFVVAQGLKENGALSNDELANKLDINEPSLDREVAFDIFSRYGCDAVCLRAALRELDALSSGKQILEEQQSSPHYQGRFASRTREQTEMEAEALLQSNPCGALEELSSRDYSILANQSLILRLKTELKDKCILGSH